MGWVDVAGERMKALEVTVRPSSSARQRVILWLVGEGNMPTKGQNKIADVIHHALNAAVAAMEAYEAWERLGPEARERVANELAAATSPEGQNVLRRVGAAVTELLSYPRVLTVSRTTKRYIVNRVHDDEALVTALEKAAAALRKKRGRGVGEV
jgi:hypothetical protein